MRCFLFLLLLLSGTLSYGALSQTQGLLYREGLEQLFETVPEAGRHREQIVALLEQEAALSDSYYVVYHASAGYAIVRDTLTALLAVDIPVPDDFIFLRPPWKEIYAVMSVDDYFRTAGMPMAFSPQDPNWRTNVGSWQAQILCVNLTLFGNYDQDQESTLHYWDTHTGAQPPPIELLLEEIVTHFGMDVSEVKTLMEIYEPIRFDDSALIAIFIPKDRPLLDEIMYLSSAYYAPVPYDDLRPSQLLDLYEKDVLAVRDYRHLQGRLVMTRQGLLNPHSGIRFLSLDAVNAEQRSLYKQQLAAWVEKTWKTRARGAPCSSKAPAEGVIIKDSPWLNLWLRPWMLTSTRPSATKQP